MVVGPFPVMRRPWLKEPRSLPGMRRSPPSKKWLRLQRPFARDCCQGELELTTENNEEALLEWFPDHLDPYAEGT